MHAPGLGCAITPAAQLRHPNRPAHTLVSKWKAVRLVPPPAGPNSVNVLVPVLSLWQGWQARWQAGGKQGGRGSRGGACTHAHTLPAHPRKPALVNHKQSAGSGTPSKGWHLERVEQVGGARGAHCMRHHRIGPLVHAAGHACTARHDRGGWQARVQHAPPLATDFWTHSQYVTAW